jgi:gamma-glutamyltranspeptidase / glutathione hydrolase
MPEPTFDSYRSPLLATRGMVASSQPLATQAGLSILMQGGNAADAAVAVAAALNMTEPTSTGIGGDMFALYFDSKTKNVTALNGSGRAPKALTIDLLREQGLVSGDFEISDPIHAHTVTIPGACAGWCDLIARHGSMPLSTILAPAIRLGEDGYPVAPMTAHFWSRGRQLQGRGETMLINGQAPQAGQLFHNPDLARTFRTVGEGGKDAFYNGSIGRRIAAAVQFYGGVMTEADLAAHTSTWDEPISTTYRGYQVWECPPNGQGLAALMALNVLEGFDLATFDAYSPERLHLVIEALRVAFADTRWYVADPAFNPAPLEGLLSKAYASERRALINRQQAMMDTRHGSPVAGSDTVYFCVADGQGNACSFINSNYMGFGTGIIPEGTGFTLQNRGHNFSLDPNHPNALAPGKRPYHTIIPGMLMLEDGSLYGPFGVMGGFMQPQGHAQVVIGMIDDGLDPQAALNRLRVCLAPGEASGGVALEVGLPAETVARLSAMGHRVETVSGYGRAMFGRGQIIRRDADGVLWGGSDPRADGCAMGY